LPGEPSDAYPGRVAAFRKASKTAYVEAQNVTVEYHWRDGRYDGLPALMADFVRLHWRYGALPLSSPCPQFRNNPRRLA
jgi:hypothetical protein